MTIAGYVLQGGGWHAVSYFRKRMPIEIYIGRQGCGMGLCALLQAYSRDSKYVAEHIKEFPEKCQECIRLNEEEKKKG